MCKEMPVIPVSKMMDPKKNNRTKWRAEEEERHRGSLAKKVHLCHFEDLRKK
jgi:hypothetical protein